MSASFSTDVAGLELPAAHPPEHGESAEQLAQGFKDSILPGITHWQHPSFFAYFPANASFEGILADLYSASVSNPGFNWACSPACTELETIVMNWGVSLLGLDQSFTSPGGGIIMASSSCKLC
jgi:aromatic-L-amino-acid decarboxylase